MLPPLHALLQQSSPSHIISRLYRATQASQPFSLLSARGHWEADLGFALTDAQWQYCCTQTGDISASSKFHLLHYKYLHRVYYTPARLFRFQLRDSSACARCGEDPAEFQHLAWNCPPIRRYWSEVFAALRCMTGHHIPETPLVALLGYTVQLLPAIRKYTSLALLLAKRRVSCRWGRGRAPKFKTWVQDLIYCQDQLNTYADLLPPTSRPRDIWAHLQTYLLTTPTLSGPSTPTRPGSGAAPNAPAAMNES